MIIYGAAHNAIGICLGAKVEARLHHKADGDAADLEEAVDTVSGHLEFWDADQHYAMQCCEDSMTSVGLPKYIGH